MPLLFTRQNFDLLIKKTEEQQELIAKLTAELALCTAELTRKPQARKNAAKS